MITALPCSYIKVLIPAQNDSDADSICEFEEDEDTTDSDGDVYMEEDSDKQLSEKVEQLVYCIRTFV